MTNTNPEDVAPPIGEVLSSARKQRGKSIEDVERAIKIRAKYLSALEADAFEVLPGDAYVAGFIKTYADYLGLDSHELVQAYRQTHLSPPLEIVKPLMPAPRRRGITRTLLWLAGLLLAALTLSALLRALEPPQHASPPPRPAKSAKPKASTTAPAEKKKSETSAVPRPFVLKVVATDGGNWIAVKVDGRMVFDGQLEPGSRRLWRVKRRILLRSTTPALFKVYRDGKFIGKLGSGDSLKQRVYVPAKK